MDFRKTFDRIPETFDKYRPRYCDELLREIITVSDLISSNDVLQIGPGTGQATEPILKPGGILAMFMTCSDEKSANEELYNRIDEVYKEHLL
jgi:hypothetical protein